MVSGSDGQDVRLSAKYEEEAGRLVGKVDAEHVGAAHVAGQRGPVAFGVVGRYVAHHHQETQCPVQNDFAVVGLLLERVFGVLVLVFVLVVIFVFGFVFLVSTVFDMDVVVVPPVLTSVG